MKGKNENKLDQLFKDGLSGSEDHIAFREEDWTSMERLLDDKPSKKAVLLRRIYYISGIAAMLLLVIGLFFLIRDNGQENPTRNQLAIKNRTQTKGNNDHSGQQLKDSISKSPAVNESLGSNNSVQHSEQSKSDQRLPANRNGHYFPNGLNPTTVPPVIAKTPVINKLTKDSSINNNNNNPVDINKTVPPPVNQPQNNIATITSPDTATTKTTESVQQVKTDKGSIKPILRRGPRFTLSILAAPDINAVNSFNRNQVGTNLGFQLGIRLSKKFSISTGAAYAIKPYDASGSQYNSLNWQGKASDDLPTNVAANCKVLDIPINLNYKFYSKGKNSFALGTGLSSYIMLRENYHFDFNDGSGRPSYDVQIDNKNRHILGVLNLNATYERKINSKFSTIIQPYMKLPLTGIGNGRVDLKSTGVALGVSWNINSVLKPK
ncbi:MAG: hypothetical protein JWR38_5745 [Mucilaginibacter sp.]|nr:hypothetical protein [Mucilaginibacter sp.]